ncbi:uncharacterized protein [Palaemon carinicauda]|uniref:uncharacterized protein n=1 Tax=Palaemon carinicauda TaxID=392227 RepID=UPI0035B681DF
MVDSRLTPTLEVLSEFNFIVNYCPGDQNAAGDWLSHSSTLTDCLLATKPTTPKLPTGLALYKEVCGGPDSLIESLELVMNCWMEGSDVAPNSQLQGAKLWDALVQQFLKDAGRLGLKLDKTSRNRIKAMRFPGTVSALGLLLAVSTLLNLEMWVYWGPTCPVVYRDPSVTEPQCVHLQYLSGVLFNPLIELRNYVPPTDVILGHKAEVKSRVREAEGLVTDDQEAPEDYLVIQYVTEKPPRQSSCMHVSQHSAVGTKYPEVIPVKNISVKVIAEKLSDIFTKFGIPEIVQSDRGTNFMSKLFQDVRKLLDVKQQLSTAYHPETQECALWEGPQCLLILTSGPEDGVSKSEEECAASVSDDL